MRARQFLLGLLAIILVLVLTVASMAILAFIQARIFLPHNYIMWTFNYPISRGVFIFEYYLLYLFFRKTAPVRQLTQFAKRNKQWFYPLFAIANLVLVYALIFNVSVITQNTITNYTFLLPQGKVYRYTDITGINTGVYEHKSLIPFTHAKGEFYYKIRLQDGTQIDLNGDFGGAKDDRDVYQVFEEIDTNLVNMGIPKTSNLASFQYFDKNIDKVYADRIKHILANTQ